MVGPERYFIQMIILMLYLFVVFCSWQAVREMGKCRAGAGVVTVQCHTQDLASPPNVVSSV